MFDDILTDLEKTKIEQFCADPEMVEAVRKVMLTTIYNQGVLVKGKKADPLHNAALGIVFRTVRAETVVDNEKLGEDLRGMAHGINFLESGFERLSKIKTKTQI
jgi:hypothetical protein